MSMYRVIIKDSSIHIRRIYFTLEEATKAKEEIAKNLGVETQLMAVEFPDSSIGKYMSRAAARYQAELERRTHNMRRLADEQQEYKAKGIDMCIGNIFAPLPCEEELEKWEQDRAKETMKTAVIEKNEPEYWAPCLGAPPGVNGTRR